MKFLFPLWLHLYIYFHLQCKMELYYVVIIIIIIKTNLYGLCLRANYTDRANIFIIIIIIIIINGSTALLLNLDLFLNLIQSVTASVV
jgi:hypothetical protein